MTGDLFRRNRRVTVWAAVLTMAMAGLAACTRAPEQRAARFLELGRRQMQQHRILAAILEFKNAVQATPRAAEPYYQLGRAYAAARDWTDAVASYRRACELNPGHRDAQLALAEVLTATAESNLWAEAEAHAAAAVKAHPGDADALTALGGAERRLGKTAAAVSHLGQALAAEPGHLRASLLLAGIHAEQRDAAEAHRLLETALQHHRESADALLAIGRFYAVLAEPAAAEACLRRAAGMDPQNGPALQQLAALQLSLGQREAAEATLRHLSAIPSGAYRTAHADFVWESGNRDAAIAELEDLRSKYPDSREIRNRLVDAYVATGREPRAEALLNEALRRNAQDAGALERRARLYLAAGRIDQAGRDSTEALRWEPRSGTLHCLQARVYGAQGRAELSRRELTDAVQLDPALLDCRLELSENLRQNGSARDALAVLDQMPAAQRPSTAANIERSWVLLALGRIDEAQRGVEQGLAAGASAPLLFQRGLLWSKRRQLQAARRDFEQALELAPQDVDVLNAIATTYQSEKRPSQAIERIARQAARYPTPALQHLLGSWLEGTGDVAGARAAYAAALVQDPHFLPSRLAAARLDMTSGRWDRARQVLAVAIESNPTNADVLFAQGMLEEGTGHYPAAIALYRRALESAPNHVGAMNNLAVRLSEDPRTVNEAVQLAQRVQALAPDNPAVNDTIGWTYCRKGIYSAAVKYLTRAAAGSRSAQVQYHLAIAEFHTGRRDLGEAALRVARKLDANAPEAALAQSAANATR